jgi:hypothetical protein
MQQPLERVGETENVVEVERSAPTLDRMCGAQDLIEKLTIGWRVLQCDVIEGTSDVRAETCDVIEGTSDVRVETCDVIEGTSDVRVETCDVIAGGRRHLRLGGLRGERPRSPRV